MGSYITVGLHVWRSVVDLRGLTVPSLAASSHSLTNVLHTSQPQIDQIAALQRPITMEEGGPVLMDLLWSDPTTNDGVTVRQRGARCHWLQFDRRRCLSHHACQAPLSCWLALDSDRHRSARGVRTQLLTRPSHPALFAFFPPTGCPAEPARPRPRDVWPRPRQGLLQGAA